MAPLLRSIASLLVVAVLATACSGSDDDAVTPIGTSDTSASATVVTTPDATPDSATTPATATDTVTTTTSTTERPMTTTEPPSDDAPPTDRDDPRVVWAIDETSEHFGYPRDEISVASIEPVTWPTAALGCPATGVTYAQVEVPGYRITLTWADVTIVYHGALDGTLPFRCEFLD